MNMYDTLKASSCVIPIVKKLNSKINSCQNQGNNTDIKTGQAGKTHYSPCFIMYFSSSFTSPIKMPPPNNLFSRNKVNLIDCL